MQPEEVQPEEEQPEEEQPDPGQPEEEQPGAGVLRVLLVLLQVHRRGRVLEEVVAQIP